MLSCHPLGTWAVDHTGIYRAAFHYAGVEEKKKSLIVSPVPGKDRLTLEGYDGLGRPVTLTLCEHRNWSTGTTSSDGVAAPAGWRAL